MKKPKVGDKVRLRRLFGLPQWNGAVAVVVDGLRRRQVRDIQSGLVQQVSTYLVKLPDNTELSVRPGQVSPYCTSDEPAHWDTCPWKPKELRRKEEDDV